MNTCALGQHLTISMTDLEFLSSTLLGDLYHGLKLCDPLAEVGDPLYYRNGCGYSVHPPSLWNHTCNVFSVLI